MKEKSQRIKRIKSMAAALLLTAMLLPTMGCSQKETNLTFFAMDTYMQLKAYGSGAEEALQEAKQKVMALDKELSFTDPDSPLSLLNREGRGELSREAVLLVEKAKQYREETDGAFDCTVAPAVEAWGFYNKRYSIPSQEAIMQLQDLIDSDSIEVRGNDVKLSPGQKIDLGGIAKGYASQQIASLLRERGICSALIVLGGSVQAIGGKTDGSPWKVAIQNPEGGNYLGVWQGWDMAVVTSGDYQRCFEQDGVLYHHILDPKTASPAKSDLRSVTVLCEDAMKADAYSTALFVMGLERAVAFWREKGGFDMILYTSGGNIYITSQIQDSFQTALPCEVLL